jgi:phage virion morphogenesis protein
VSGAVFEIDARELDRVRFALVRMSSARFDKLADTIGTELDSQTKERIEDDKKAPDGTPWASWSSEYAKTRHAGQSLLQGESHLLDSITHNVVDGSDVEHGSNLEYAAVHQYGHDFGRRRIPARPYLGLSRDNERDILAVADDWLRGEGGVLFR